MHVETWKLKFQKSLSPKPMKVGIKNNDQLMVQEVALDDFSDDESDESD